MSDNTEEAERLLQEGEPDRRTTAEPDTDSDTDAKPDLQDAIKASYEAIDDDEMPIHLQYRDRDLAAILAGLDDADALEQLIDAAADTLDKDTPENVSRANAMKLLIRIGLNNVDASVIEDATKAKQQHAMEQASEI